MEKTGILVKTTLVDFPGLVACTLFLPGCNLRCPYCYNVELARGYVPEDLSVTKDQVFTHLEKRKNVLQGFVLSGGEPLLSLELKKYIQKARSLGYQIKLDTNGLMPGKLKELLMTPDLAPDFIALDVKTSPDRYNELNPQGCSIDTEALLLQSIDLLSSLPSCRREFRTVLVPDLVKKEDIQKIAEVLPKDSSWQFAPFMNQNCLDSSWNELSPYSDSQAKELVQYAQSLIPGAQLR